MAYAQTDWHDVLHRLSSGNIRGQRGAVRVHALPCWDLLRHHVRQLVQRVPLMLSGNLQRRNWRLLGSGVCIVQRWHIHCNDGVQRLYFLPRQLQLWQRGERLHGQHRLLQYGHDA